MKHLVRILSAAVLLIALGSVDAQDGRARRVSIGNYALELDGVVMGFLHSAGGGDVSAPVVTEVVGPDQVVRKHLGSLVYGDVTMQIGFDLHASVYQWIARSWTPTSVPKSGSIHQLDANLNAVRQRQFFGALITETTIPACDGSVREPGYLTVKFAPEYTRDQKASGNVRGNLGTKQKSWNPANFRLSIDGVDCSKVAKVDSFTVKHTYPPAVIGGDRNHGLEPGKIEFPNLKVTLPESSAETWSDWFQKFVVQGVNDQNSEKSGTLELLSTDLRTVLATVKFHNLGIFKLAPESASAKNCDCDLCETVVEGANSAAKIRRLTAELYCERMEFLPPSPIAGD